MNSFTDKIYNLLKQVPAGRVTTYKYLARAANSRAYRAVGQVLKNNPNAPIVACHRVINSNGEIGGFMGSLNKQSVAKKIKLLQKEGIKVEKTKIKDFERRVFKFGLT